jgi:hypothetical protein
MNKLEVYRGVSGLLAIAVVVLGVVLWQSEAKGHDGDPSGLDVSLKKSISANVQTAGTVSCLTSNGVCNLQVEMHYLESPPPVCTDSTASGCASVGSPRALAACSGDNVLCVSVAPTPLTVDLQDADGWRHYPSTGEFIIILRGGARSPAKP